MNQCGPTYTPLLLTASIRYVNLPVEHNSAADIVQPVRG
jgi:hypothetical protein